MEVVLGLLLGENVGVGGGSGGRGALNRTALRGVRMTGSALQGGGRCIGIASRRECWNWEGVQGEGGSKSDRAEGMRIFSDALKAWQAQRFHHF